MIAKEVAQVLGQNGPKIVGAYGRYTGGTQAVHRRYTDGTIQHMPNAAPFRSSQEQVLLSFLFPAPRQVREKLGLHRWHMTSSITGRFVIFVLLCIYKTNNKELREVVLLGLDESIISEHS